MRAMYSFFLLAILCSAAVSQEPQQAFDQVTSKAFLKQILQDGVYDFISSGAAQSLLVKRVDPKFPTKGMVARVSGTVIVAFELSKNGTVVHPMAVSGPALLKPLALAAVRQWKFKPYLLNGKPVTVATSIPIRMQNF